MFDSVGENLHWFCLLNAYNLAHSICDIYYEKQKK